MQWHLVFESLAYIVAFRIYLRARTDKTDPLDSNDRLKIIVAAIAGAAVGSRLLYLFENPLYTLREWTNVAYLAGGKTVVGALLGGTGAVEFVKWRSGIRQRTGDLFAIPLAIGIAIGRIGCLLAGLRDDTYGNPTSMPWGIDLGDGIRRHPVQLYETLAMVLLTAILVRLKPPRFAEGDRFRVFIFAYFVWRVFIDFLKPEMRFGGLSVLQWAAALAVVWYARDAVRICREFTVNQNELTHGCSMTQSSLSVPPVAAARKAKSSLRDLSLPAPLRCSSVPPAAT